MSTEITLVDRKQIKGEFHKRAIASQAMKSTMRWQDNWESMGDDKKEALEGIIDKISSILCGDPNCAKTWKSIMGFTKLIVDALEVNNDNIEMVSTTLQSE